MSKNIVLILLCLVTDIYADTTKEQHLKVFKHITAELYLDTSPPKTPVVDKSDSYLRLSIIVLPEWEQPYSLDFLCIKDKSNKIKSITVERRILIKEKENKNDTSKITMEKFAIQDKKLLTDIDFLFNEIEYVPEDNKQVEYLKSGCNFVACKIQTSKKNHFILRPSAYNPYFSKELNNFLKKALPYRTQMNIDN